MIFLLLAFFIWIKKCCFLIHTLIHSPSLLFTFLACTRWVEENLCVCFSLCSREVELRICWFCFNSLEDMKSLSAPWFSLFKVYLLSRALLSPKFCFRFKFRFAGGIMVWLKETEETVPDIQVHGKKWLPWAFCFIRHVL